MCEFLKRVELHDRLMTREPEPTDALLHRFSPTHLGASSGLRVGELLGLKWEDVSFESLEVNVVRAVVKQKITRCKTEASRKPIPGRRVGKGSVELEASISISADPRLGVCKSENQGQTTVLARLALSCSSPTRARSGRDFGKRGLAHLATHVRHFDESEWRGHQDDPRTVAAFELPSDGGYLYASGHPHQTCRTNEAGKDDFASQKGSSREHLKAGFFLLNLSEPFSRRLNFNKSF